MEVKSIQESNTKYIGKEVIYYKTIESTHIMAKELAKRGVKNGTILIAEEQTGGIGTKGRNWYTGKNNIAMSIILYPKYHANSLEKLTIEIAQCMKKTIKELYAYNLEIKEPNDLMLNGKKISGILTQIATQNETVKYLIISIGFNVNEENFSDEISNIATSLKKEYGKEYNRERIICKFIEILERKIQKYYL